MSSLNDQMSAYLSGISSMGFYDKITGSSVMEFKIQDGETEIKEVEQAKTPKPFEIKSALDKYVIGQEEAKMALSVAAYNHYKRCNYKEKDIQLHKSNILMVGKSGCGKTLLAETLANVMGVPFLSVDITEYSPTGIVGEDVNDIPSKLLQAADGDAEKASRGVVFIDEIDKICTGDFGNAKVRGTTSVAMQPYLLKLLEGKQKKGSSSWFGGGGTTVDTKNVLFICAGAFSGIENIMETGFDRPPIGFGNVMIKPKMQDKKAISTENIISYGMMPELAGRLPVLVNLKPLEREDLKRILVEPQNAIIEQYVTLCDMDGVVLEFADDALDAIVDAAVALGTGARGLRTVVERALTPLMYNITLNEDYWKCVVTADTILHNAKPRMLSNGQLE